MKQKSGVATGQPRLFQTFPAGQLATKSVAQAAGGDNQDAVLATNRILQVILGGLLSSFSRFSSEQTLYNTIFFKVQ